MTDAILIVAGLGNDHGVSMNTAELFVPSSGLSCELPSLSDKNRQGHTVESSGLLCGGFLDVNCLLWRPDTGTWEDYLQLDVERYLHVSWTPGTDVGNYLMGGSESNRSTTLVTPEGTQEPGFQLKYDT